MIDGQSFFALYENCFEFGEMTYFQSVQKSIYFSKSFIKLFIVAGTDVIINIFL